MGLHQSTEESSHWLYLNWIIFESGIDYIILSAHNESSLKNVNEIVVLSDRSIVYQGGWDKFNLDQNNFLNPL